MVKLGNSTVKGLFHFCVVEDDFLKKHSYFKPNKKELFNIETRHFLTQRTYLCELKYCTT